MNGFAKKGFYKFNFRPWDTDWKDVFNNITLKYFQSGQLIENFSDFRNEDVRILKIAFSNFFQMTFNSMFVKPIVNQIAICPIHVQYCALASMILTTLHVKINKLNIYGCVRSEGVSDNDEAHETYYDKSGDLKTTRFKRIVNGHYCAIMYLFILQKYNFIQPKSSFMGMF